MNDKKKYWANEAYAKLVLILLIPFALLFYVLMPIGIRDTGVALLFAGFLTVMIALMGIPYILHGYFDRISIDSTGITVYRLWKQTHFDIDSIAKVKKVEPQTAYHFYKQCYSICININNEKLRKEIYFYGNTELVEEIKKYKLS